MSERARNRPLDFLLVEDDEDHAILVRRTLERQPATRAVRHMADGEAAMEYLHDAPSRGLPDVILLDLNLPRAGGLEVLARIKRDPRLATIPVVVLTTSRAEGDRARAYAEHANSYLVKPIDFVQFVRMVQVLSDYWGRWNAPPPLGPS